MVTTLQHSHLVKLFSSCCLVETCPYDQIVLFQEGKEKEACNIKWKCLPGTFGRYFPNKLSNRPMRLTPLCPFFPWETESWARENLLQAHGVFFSLQWFLDDESEQKDAHPQLCTMSSSSFWVLPWPHESMPSSSGVSHIRSLSASNSSQILAKFGPDTGGRWAPGQSSWSLSSRANWSCFS